MHTLRPHAGAWDFICQTCSCTDAADCVQSRRSAEDKLSHPEKTPVPAQRCLQRALLSPAAGHRLQTGGSACRRSLLEGTRPLSRANSPVALGAAPPASRTAAPSSPSLLVNSALRPSGCLMLVQDDLTSLPLGSVSRSLPSARAGMEELQAQSGGQADICQHCQPAPRGKAPWGKAPCSPKVGCLGITRGHEECPAIN